MAPKAAGIANQIGGVEMTTKSDAFLQVSKRPGKSDGKKSSNQEAGEWVYQEIMDAILEQRLAPGMKLGEELLGEIFDVSRPVVRWALNKLTHDNVVELRPHRGAFIARPTVAHAQHVFEARRIVERAVVSACVDNATERDCERIRKHIEMEADAARQGQRGRWIRLTGEFHLLLSAIGGNQVLNGFLEDLVTQTSLIIALYGNNAGSICSGEDHTMLANAIEAGDQALAQSLMNKHLLECEASLHIEDEPSDEDLRSIFSHVGTRQSNVS